MVLLPLRLPYGVRTLPAFTVLLPMEFRVNTHLMTKSIGVTMELAFLISWLLFGIGISAV